MNQNNSHKYPPRNPSVHTRDLLGSVKPSLLFYPLFALFSNLLNCDPKSYLSRLNIVLRKVIHPIILFLVPFFMDYKQRIENKETLLGAASPGTPQSLPKEPVIWCVNHGFKDDIAATIRATRHSHVFFGSIPHFFNTFDGIALSLNGVILCNRKRNESKKAAFHLAVETLKCGNDVTIFPEGVWNKTPEKLTLDLWPGIYRMAKETGSKIIPVIHYLRDPNLKYPGNVIHTVIADPISMVGLSEEEGLALLRDSMATWYYLLMEKYGQTTRQALLDAFNTSDEAWESFISRYTSCVKYYDSEIELSADYRPRRIVRPKSVWQNVANIQHLHAGNIGHVQYAKQLISREQNRDFQRRF